MSSTEVDDIDPRFNYKDNQWSLSTGDSREFGSTAHLSTVGGAQVMFGPFTGSSIAVFSTVGTTQTKVHFEVDGVQSSDLPEQNNQNVQFQQQVYSASNLNPTAQHTLQINLLDPGPFTLDYVLIGNGQSPIVAQQTTAAAEPNGSLTHLTGTLGAPSSSSTSPTASTQNVGNIPTSSSLTSSVASSSIPSLSPATTFSSSPVTSFPSQTPAPSAFLSSPTSTATGTNFTSLGQSPASPAGTNTTSASAGPTATSMGTASDNGLDATVIGAVTGSIVLFAIVVVSVVLYLRRRRRYMQRGRFIPNNKPSGWQDSQAKQRPSLHLSIPSSLSIPRSMHIPSLLPTHSKSFPTTTNQNPELSTSRTTPSFLAEDPTDSPVFDIKQRPISGSTMTTRVTVGTAIGQRVSLPDSVYRYSYVEPPAPIPVPPLPPMPTQKVDFSPTDTGASSATGTGSPMGFGLLGTNFAGTLDTSIFSGLTENGTGATAASGLSASRPLPYTPTGVKPTSVKRVPGPGYPHSPRFLPSTPSEMETVVHQDGGVRLASSVHAQPRQELPPPYQDYGL